MSRIASQQSPGWIEQAAITEKLLQFIWQFQYFNTQDLRTIGGEKVDILSPGILNVNQGPDFSDAQVRIDGTLWVGTVELHLKTSQWKVHGHSADPGYGNVILHVVLDHNGDGYTDSIPILELCSRIPGILLHQYKKLMESNAFIPCGSQAGDVADIVWTSWKDRLLVERLGRRSALVLRFHEENKGDWKSAYWWLLARTFGMKINSDAFESVARSLPPKLLSRHVQQVIQLESLLLGQAQLLNQDFSDAYPRLLQREYRFLAKKYGLVPSPIPVHFLRMRPRNFPTIRLAQLAVWLQQPAGTLDALLQCRDIMELKKEWEVVANDYWNDHYLPDEPAIFQPKHLGAGMIDLLLVNCMVPMVFAYGRYHRDTALQEKALGWLEGGGAEANTVTRGFQKLGLPNNSAFDSQAYLELKSQYCDSRKCLSCPVGNAVLRASAVT